MSDPYALAKFIGNSTKEQRDWLDTAFAKIAVGDPLPSFDPIPLLLTCPAKGCGKRHIDEGEFATKAHHTHACQHCGHVWRPAIKPTVGVQFLPGFKNET